MFRKNDWGEGGGKTTDNDNTVREEGARGVYLKGRNIQREEIVICLKYTEQGDLWMERFRLKPA